MMPWREIFLSLLVALPASGDDTLSFGELWSRVRKGSPSLSAAGHAKQAAELEYSTSKKSWYPRIYADGRGYATDNPALTFMSELNQRQIASTDFSPDSLNHPPSQLFARATLGADLPLYQGGAATARERASAKRLESKTWEEAYGEVSEYTDAARAYAELLVLAERQNQAGSLLASVDELIRRYQIGAQGNPVGYSGLLGMKSLRNRLRGIVEETSLRAKAIREKLGLIAPGLPETWVTEALDCRAFVDKWLPAPRAAGSAAPALVKAAVSGAEALEESSSQERGKLLPQVGLFAEGYLTAGSRAAATSYAGGAYLKWDLFSADSWGSLGSSRESALAARAHAEAVGRRAAVARTESIRAEQAASRNLALLRESTDFLEEQVKTSQRLFRDGSINALQLVEVFSRRADLMERRSELELSLVTARATALVFSGTPLPQGGRYEH